jgi:hypothetical protein
MAEPTLVRLNQVPVSLGSGTTVLPQAERYYEGTDTFVVESDASREELEAFAATLRFTIEPR